MGSGFSLVPTRLVSGATRSVIRVEDVLRRLGGASSWSARDWYDFHRLVRCVEVGGQVAREYAPGWRSLRDSEPAGPRHWRDLVALFLAAAERTTDRGVGLKGLNAVFRAFDLAPDANALRSELESAAGALLDRLDVRADRAFDTDASSSPRTARCSGTRGRPSGADRVLPLTVLVQEGPQARAYLWELARRGWRVARVLHLVRDRHRATGRPIGRWLPSGLRLGYARWVGELTELHWPRRIRTRHPQLVHAIGRALATVVPDPRAAIEALTGSFDYGAFADHYDRVLVRDLRDERLVEAFTHNGPSTVLFTGGGIVPKSLLTIPGVRFLHVHPGHLPAVRGADGLLWSVWLRGRPGLSAFFMDAGIDTGDLIEASDESPFRVTLPPGDFDADTLYRSVFATIDPLLRARFLSDRIVGLDPPPDLRDLPAQPQLTKGGCTFHFLHPRLRERALARLFARE